MKNIARNYKLNSFTRWVYINHPDWCDHDDYTVLSVIVERLTMLNGEVIIRKVLERQDHVIKVMSKESMAAEACLKMSSINIDEEVYVGF